MATPTPAAEGLKNVGNVYFGKEKYAAASEQYTEAITLCPRWCIPYVNRALCQRKLGNWENVERDCMTALKLDHDNVKAQYMLGLCLLEKKNNVEATSWLTKSLESARESGSGIQDEIWRALARAKYEGWKGPAKKRKARMDSLQVLLRDLLRQHHASKRAKGGGGSEMDVEGEGGDSAGPDMVVIEDSQDGGGGGGSGGGDGGGGGGGGHQKEGEAGDDEEGDLAELARVFEVAGRSDVPSEVPDWATCKLSFEVFRDPVVGPAGLTYEKSFLEEHLRKVGKFDPVTRKPFSEHEVYPNVSTRNATQAYLDAHPWAYAEVLGIDPERDLAAT